MVTLAKLEGVIADLEARMTAVLDEIKACCWPDNRTHDPIPEKQHRVNLLESLELDRLVVSPEKRRLPRDASRLYQQWYSGARAIISRNSRERLKDFDAFYGKIDQLFSGHFVTRPEEFSLLDAIEHQVDILTTVPDHIRFSAYDVELEAYSVLMNDELGAAQGLFKHGFLRPAGVLAGVILERHLKNLLRKAEPPVTFRKEATLATLNDLCKDAAYDLVTWRRIQHLSDLRNLCAHDKSREPTKDEVTDFLGGVLWVVRNTPQPIT